MTPPSSLGELFDARSTRFVIIRDRWNGLGAHAPIVSLYELARDARGGLAGDGILSTRAIGEHQVRVALRPSTARGFLDALACAPVTPGEYCPRIEWTDDYPHIDIALHAGHCDDGGSARIALLFTRSQGRYHAPWGAKVDGVQWSIQGEAIGRALRRIRRALKQPTLDRLIREANERSVAD